MIVRELTLKDETEKLVEEYMKLGIIPKRKEADAIHIAQATINEIDILVSWNCSHIIRADLQKKIKGVNILNGYEDLELRTPREIVHYD